MSDYFQKRKIQESCYCKASKSVYEENGIPFKYTYDDVISNCPEEEELDILILFECKEPVLKSNAFKNVCKKYITEQNFLIMPALGCTPKNFLSEDTIVTYSCCKEKNIKKRILDLKPKIIVTVGRAIYTITESKDLKPEHFFAPVGIPLEEYQLDDTYFYSPEFNCKIVPIPALYQWIHYDGNLKDCYEYKFSIDQLNRVKKLINEPKKRMPRLEYEVIEDSSKFLVDLINNDNINEVSVDTESNGLDYFRDILHSIQFSYDGIKGFFCLWENIDKDLLNELFKKKYIVMQNGSHDLKFLKINGIKDAHCNFDTMLASWQLNENIPQGQKPNCWLYTNHGGYENELKSYMEKYRISDFTKVPFKILSRYGSYDAIIAFQLYKYFKKRLDIEDESVKNNFYNFVMPSLEMIVDVEMEGIPIDLKYLYEYNEKLKIELEKTKEEIYQLFGFKFNIRSLKELSKAILTLPNFKPIEEDGKILVTKNNDLVLNKDIMIQYEKQGYKFASLIKKSNHLAKEISQIGIEFKKIEKEVGKKFLFKEIINDEEEIVDGFMNSIIKNKLYSSYKLYGTNTGRASGGNDLDSENNLKISRKDSFGINPQNIPTTEEFRKIFLPEQGFVLGNADYDAMEVSIFSQNAGKGVLENLILENKDIHCYTSVAVLKELKVQGILKLYPNFKTHVPYKNEDEFKKFLDGIDFSKITYDEVEKKCLDENLKDPFFVEIRKISKKTNWKALYGATGFGLAKGLEVDNETGEYLLNAFRSMYPDINRYMDEQIEFAKKTGYVKTLLGRKRRLYPLTYIGKDSWKNNSSFAVFNLMNNAINSPIQGTSGQTNIIAMTNIWKEFKEKNLKSKMIINVHDEIVFIIYLDELEITKEIVERNMMKPYYKNVGGNKVTLKAELKFGEIWKNCYSINYWKEHKNEWDKILNSIETRNSENREFIEALNE